MRIDILTLFPAMFSGPFAESIIRRACNRGIVEIAVHDIREFAGGRHRIVDDYPYGGGPGMVMKPEPIAAALDAVAGEGPRVGTVVLLTPQGRRFDQAIARTYAAEERLTLLCGRYEGVDERVRGLVSDELSIGDFVLSGGEPAAIVVVDAVVRLLPGALGSSCSLFEESHTAGLLEYPHYTRPSTFRGQEVPAILLSGNHQEVARWRRLQSLLRTAVRRPDLLADAELTPAERTWLDEHLTASCVPDIVPEAPQSVVDS
ncbi:MAG: tRNA (guanosine(37)-N1)-methyltransferase TrmD [Dehalococcoidia bacterium]